MFLRMLIICVHFGKFKPFPGLHLKGTSLILKISISINLGTLNTSLKGLFCYQSYTSHPFGLNYSPLLNYIHNYIILKPINMHACKIHQITEGRLHSCSPGRVLCTWWWPYQSDDGTLRSELGGGEESPDKAIDELVFRIDDIVVIWNLVTLQSYHRDLL